MTAEMKALAKRAVIMDRNLTEFLAELPPTALLNPQEYVGAFHATEAYAAEITEDFGSTFE